MLYIVSTPIGNLGDITQRAIDILRDVDVIIAEDSRRTHVLSKRYGLGAKKIIVFNEHNEHRELPKIIELLKAEKKLALTTDSGTPAISDPGFLVVREAIKENLPISPVPGPCALVSALVCSGLPSERFTFYGFFPKKPGQRKEMIEKAKDSEFTSVFYESPYRVKKTLVEIAEKLPGRNVVLARELTKRHEQFMRGTAEEILGQYKEQVVKGEMVLMIDRKTKS